MEGRVLSERAGTILKTIVGQYVVRGIPVPSQSIIDNRVLSVSSATVRNEMMRLGQEGYITRPHASAGSIPLEKGYRYYVESLNDIDLPAGDRILIDHLFHQVEKELDKWLHQAATLMSHLVRNVAWVTTPKPASCRLKHLELILLQDSLSLLVAVFDGARVRQHLVVFERTVFQQELSAVANRLNEVCCDRTSSQIQANGVELSQLGRTVRECLLKVMQDEDEQEFDEPYLDGWHYILSQPEFARSEQMSALMELVEQRTLLRTILSSLQKSRRVQVVIGRENQAEAIQNCSVVVSRYGLPGKASGTIGVIGPTRMLYDRTISTVGYISSVLDELVAELYGKENREDFSSGS